MKLEVNVRICFERAPVYIAQCVSHLQSIKDAGGCPDGNPAICYVWFKGITSVGIPFVRFNMAYVGLCGSCLIKALNCDAYSVRQVTFFREENHHAPRDQ